ncbi:hypothetical protein V6N13_037500 [Hibiscus sabdariffa]|uniref:Uncharacterized protein n=1 Tax=Hibiscus sabdariffa TaxID=183260 RepID=A0ABR2S598_9ROSI
MHNTHKHQPTILNPSTSGLVLRFLKHQWRLGFQNQMVAVQQHGGGTIGSRQQNNDVKNGSSRISNDAESVASHDNSGNKSKMSGAKRPHYRSSHNGDGGAR